MRLSWSSPKTISRIRLFDTPNTRSWIISGSLTLHKWDNTNEHFPIYGGIRNDGGMREVVFDTLVQNVEWVEFRVKSSKGNDIGLAEIQVYDDSAYIPGLILKKEAISSE